MGTINDENNTVLIQGSSKSLLSIGLIIVISVAVITTGWFVIQRLYEPENFPIRKIELVNQIKYQKSTELQKVAARAIKGGFFSMNVNVFREELLLLPWVKTVSVRKVWPDKLLVTITERIPVVRWFSVDTGTDINHINNKVTDENTSSDTDRDILLSEEGVIFAPELTRQQRIKFSKLPLFSGPHKSADKVLKQCLKFIQMINLINTDVERCGMDARHAWKIELATTLVLNLGKNDVIIRLQRFVNVFSQQLEQYLKYLAYVDLRYSNGFSVRWVGYSADKADGMRLN